MQVSRSRPHLCPLLESAESAESVQSVLLLLRLRPAIPECHFRYEIEIGDEKSLAIASPPTRSGTTDPTQQDETSNVPGQTFRICVI